MRLTNLGASFFIFGTIFDFIGLNILTIKKLIFLSVLLMPMYLLVGELVDASSPSGAISTQVTTFIAKYFTNCRVVDIDREEDLGKIFYEVELDCGVTLEMNHLGE